MHVPKYTHFSDSWLRTSAVIHVYKARPRRNGFFFIQDVYFSLHTVLYIIVDVGSILGSASLSGEN